MKFRHEWKHEINYSDMLALRSRLNAVMKKDAHSIDGLYRSRTLYFDNLSDKALREKIDGVNIREKFRIRFYNGDLSYITLEKKSKIGGLCNKVSVDITAKEAQKIVDGDIEWMKSSGKALLVELYAKMKYQGLRPKTIVAYTREAYVYKAGNVRVTLDYNIRTGDFRTDFLNPDTITLPAGDPVIILEVKWDEFLPTIIKDAVTLTGRRVCAFSKYERCRIYG